MTFLRAGGVLFRRGTHDVIMTAPFYSNPSFMPVVLGFPIRPRPDRIRRHLPPVSDVQAILVGHAHYDHAMDVPYIALHHAPNAQVYGSETLTNLLAPLMPNERLHSVEAAAGSGAEMGEWITVPGTRIRFMPLLSEHAPHILGFKAFQGAVGEPRTDEPRTAWEWKEGQTLAYLIDFLSDDGSRVEYRVHYRDSAGNFPSGMPPPLPAEAQHPIDLAVVCVASFDEVENYPTWVFEKLQPRHALMVHWEDFFRSPSSPLATVPLLNGKRFVRRIPTWATWSTLKPGVMMTCGDAPLR